MIEKIYEKEKARLLFEGWEESLIDTAFEGRQGYVVVNDDACPLSAAAFAGDFAFFAGRPDRKLLLSKPEGFLILVPKDEAWQRLIIETFPEARAVTRYATKKDTVFDERLLREMSGQLPDGYDLTKIDETIFEKLKEIAGLRDLISNFRDAKDYMTYGKGFVVLREGKPVAGASSYTSYESGIEIEVDTVQKERRKHLAQAASAALILSCLADGLYPNWDAQNLFSLSLAEKLGYEFSHSYAAFEVL